MLFQTIFGATREKKRLALKHLAGHKSVLEIGCSMGILAPAFTEKAGVQYFGIDIDPQAIEHARTRFAGQKNATFSTQTMRELGDEGRAFDYVLFANILHHVDDPTAIELLRDALRLVARGGVLVVIEPDVLRPDDSILVRNLYRLERGQFRRPPEGYGRLLKAAGISPTEFASEDVSIDTLPGITCGHLLVYKFVAGDEAHGS
jgi:SAM-dependent methyltransferase